MVVKKSIIIVFAIIILLFGGFIAFNNFSNAKSQVTVDGTQFVLPEGYKEGVKNDLGDTNITNGNHSFFITKRNGTNISKYQVQYDNYKSKNGFNVTNSTFNVDNVTVYKSYTNESSSYWFIHEGKLYSIYSWSKNPMDSIVFEMVKSLK